MYYLALNPPSAATEPLVRHSFTLPSLASFTSDVGQILRRDPIHLFYIFFVFRPQQ